MNDLAGADRQADRQAYGYTAGIDRPLRFELLADDIAAPLQYLGIARADLMGYSLGGVALQTAIRHPEVMNRLVLVSTPFKRGDWYPEILDAQQAQVRPEVAEALKQMHLQPPYAGVAPRPEDWPVLLAKLGDLLGQDFDWSNEVAALKAPTLLVAGDADAVITAHVVEFFGLLGGGRRDGGFDGSGMSNARLAMLPGTTHYTIFSSPALASTVIAYLDAPAPAAR